MLYELRGDADAGMEHAELRWERDYDGERPGGGGDRGGLECVQYDGYRNCGGVGVIVDSGSWSLKGST